MKDIGDSYYATLVDKSRDVSTKQQLAVAVRYVDSLGQVVERFIGIKYVASTNAIALKEAMEDILAKHSLIIHRIRVIEVVEIIKEDGVHDQQAVEAGVLINAMKFFDFILAMHLLIDILGVTNELSQALQRKDQDILNAMNSTFKGRRRSARRNDDTTNLNHYRVEFFYIIIDMKLQELNNKFSETSTELLLCMSCLNPNNSFSAYDKEKLIQLAELYSIDFSIVELVALEYQVSTYILNMRSSEELSSLDNIADLAKQIVKDKKDIVYPLVHRLLVLALTLPVATATVERAF
ncbi:uncharacterized protein LOC110112213 [Dendrobium catenatum]|nr:uncharacterized protein LOC110112213 [Dendrobium catenatum]